MQREKEFFVSPRGSDDHAGSLNQPFRTLERARDAVRALHREGKPTVPVTIYLRRGHIYPCGASDLAPGRWGECSLSCCIPGVSERTSHPQRRQARDGWKESQHEGRRIWSVSLPEVRSGQSFFHQLWVDGTRRTMARHPNTGYLKVVAVPGVTEKTAWMDGSTSFQFSPGDLPVSWTFTDAEVVVMNRWIESRLPVASIDSGARLLRFTKRAPFTLEVGDYYYIENSPQALDTPGEWYLRPSGRRTVVHAHCFGEKIGRTNVVVPVLQQILLLNGEPESGRFVEHLTFEGITFSHSEWYLPDTLNASQHGGVADGGFPQAAYGLPGAVSGKGARAVTFDRCEISHVGSYAFELSRGCQGNRLLRSQACRSRRRRSKDR